MSGQFDPRVAFVPLVAEAYALEIIIIAVAIAAAILLGLAWLSAGGSMPDPIATVVVQRDGVQPTIVATPAHMPDLMVRVMSPISIVLVRALRVYLQTAVGLVTTGALAHDLVPAAQALGSWQVAASLAVGPALVCAAQNALELLARLDETMPQLRP